MTILKKFLAMVGTVLLLSFLSFLAFQVIPGDAAQVQLGTNATPEALLELREELGLNDPVLVRYARWLKGALQGDFGVSTRYRMPVSELLSQMLPNTLALALLSLLLVLVLAFPLGLLCARFEGSLFDRFFTWVNQTVMAVPSFFLGILISIFLGIVLRLFVPGRAISWSENPAECLRYLFFPALAIALPKAAMSVRFLKSSLITEKNKDYVRTARGKGMSRTRVLLTQMLGNAMISVVTFLGVVAAEVLAGSIVVEQVFGVNGLGRLLVASIANRDYNVVQAIILYLGIAVVLVNLLVDVLYRRLDPRVRRQAS